MTKILSAAAFILGACVVLWMGSAFVDSNLLALSVTVVIGAVYAVGLQELLRFQQNTASLSKALSSLNSKVTDLEAWLQTLPVSLQNPVRLRVQGEHVGLPAPVLAPYLIGLLVMLGLLGTFAGMVDTLKGAVMALEGTTELEAIRAGLAAPIKGLGMAFGTSVAGVAASAMLGFISTLSRRDRLLASRQLDSKIGGELQQFSLAHNRQQTYRAMQMQAQALPDVAHKLTLLVDKLEHMSDRIGSRLADNQDRFHASVEGVYSKLASSVDKSLQQSLSSSARLAGESIAPLLQELMQDIRQETQASQQQLTATAQQQLQAMTTQLTATSEKLEGAWQSGLTAQQRASDTLLTRIDSGLASFNQQFEGATTALLQSFSQASSEWLQRQQESDQGRLQHWSAQLDQTSTALQQSAADMATGNQTSAEQMLAKISQLLSTSEQLVQARVETEANWLSGHEQRMQQLTATLQTELAALRDAEESRSAGAAARLTELQTVVTEHLSSLGMALEAPMSRLLETAAEAPRAAAEVIEKLRSEISNTIERDNELLQERARILAELNSLSNTVQRASLGQRDAIESMVTSSAGMLQEVGSRFNDSVAAESLKLSEVVDQFAGSATELSSLGEAFGLAVQMFSESNSNMMGSLSRIEESLQQSGQRSDEQLAYYVAQAREIIDHSMLSQQEIIDQLRQLSSNAELAAEAC